VVEDVQALLGSSVQGDRLPRIHGIESDKGIVAALVTASLPSQADAVYAGYCSQGAQETEYAIVIRTDRAPYKDVIGEAKVRNLRPCLSPDGTRYSYPLVLPANMDFNSDGSGRIVQLGYAECLGNTPKCGDNMPQDGQPHFVYTPNDNSGGIFDLADGWACEPILGHKYRFKIEKDGSLWHYCIRDVTTAAAYFCTSRFRTWSARGAIVWFGTEVQNHAAGMGNCWCGGGEEIGIGHALLCGWSMVGRGRHRGADRIRYSALPVGLILV
jgi:hypothetical protein